MAHAHDGDLFARITSLHNLLVAARTAARGKRYRRSAAAFLLRAEAECLQLADELWTGRWRPGPYRVFRITDPKDRTICAAPFRDRVVHQALVQCLEERFERGFVHDSYSCRLGKGTHAALQRVAGWAREYPWALKVDVAKYFPSVDHQVALDLVGRRVRCSRTLALLARIVGSWRSDEAPLVWFPGDELFTPGERPRGLPIGNLTSQFLANVVLDAVDHRVKDGLGVRAYARYCDDMVVFGRSPDELHAVRREIAAALARLRLVPHARKTQVLPTAQGVRWVGFVVYPQRVALPDEQVARVRRRLRAFARAAGAGGGRAGTRAAVDAAASMAAWSGHGQHGLSPRRLQRLLGLSVAARGGPVSRASR